MKDYEIKELDFDNIDQCYSFWNIDGKHEKLRNQIENGSRKMFVYSNDHKYLGGASLVLNNGDCNRTIPTKRAYLSYLSVNISYQNRGIGTLLIDYICAYAKQIGFFEMTIKVDKANTLAVKLYLKKGFNNIVLENDEEMLLLKAI